MIRPRKIDSEKSVTFEKTECATRVLYFISRIFQMKCAIDVNNFFLDIFFGELAGLPLTLIILMFFTLDTRLRKRIFRKHHCISVMKKYNLSEKIEWWSEVAIHKVRMLLMGGVGNKNLAKCTRKGELASVKVCICFSEILYCSLLVLLWNCDIHLTLLKMNIYYIVCSFRRH